MCCFICKSILIRCCFICKVDGRCQAVANSKDGEPATNVAISESTNVHVVGCTFSHLGAIARPYTPLPLAAYS